MAYFFFHEISMTEDNFIVSSSFVAIKYMSALADLKSWLVFSMRTSALTMMSKTS